MTAATDDSRDDDLFDLRARAMLDGDAERVDVTKSVLDRLARDEDPAPPSLRPGRGGRWLAAAMLLLGLTVVGAVLLYDPGTAADEGLGVDQPAGDTTAERFDPPDPAAWHEVRTAAEIAALPEGVRSVRGTNLTDELVATLARRDSIEVLELRAGRIHGAPPPHSLSAAALPHIARLTGLRQLTLENHPDLSGVDLAPLATLPVLEHLAIRAMDTLDAHLAVAARLPSLRQLDLTLNAGFGRAGLEHIAGAPGLETLTLESCGQLVAEDLVPLSRLRRLRELNLRGIGTSTRGITVFDDQVRTLVDLPPALGETAIAHEQAHARPVFTSGMPDAFARVIASLSSLETLSLASTRISSGGIAALAPLEKLLRLDLSTNEGLQPDVAALPPGLRELRLAHTSTDDATIAELIAQTRVRSIDLTGTGITAASLDRLRRAPHVEELAFGEFEWDVKNHVLPLFDDGIRVRWTGDAQHRLASLTEAWAGNRPLRRDVRIAAEKGVAPPLKLRANLQMNDGYRLHLVDGAEVDVRCFLSVSATRSFLVLDSWNPKAAPADPDSAEAQRIVALIDRWANETWSAEEQAAIVSGPPIEDRTREEQYDNERKRLLRKLRLYQRVTSPQIAKVFAGGGTISLSLALTPSGGREQILLWRALDGDAFVSLYRGDQLVPIDSREEAVLLLSMANWLRNQTSDATAAPFAEPPQDLSTDASMVWNACRTYLTNTSPRLRRAGTLMDGNPGGSRAFTLSAPDFSETRYRFDHARNSNTAGRLYVDDQLVEPGSSEEKAAMATLRRAVELRRRSRGLDPDEEPDDVSLAMLEEELEAYAAAFLRGR